MRKLLLVVLLIGAISMTAYSPRDRSTAIQNERAFAGKSTTQIVESVGTIQATKTDAIGIVGVILASVFGLLLVCDIGKTVYVYYKENHEKI
jgi:uncharacterized BrkB/YihY/UPF0761 family membrane protein